MRHPFHWIQPTARAQLLAALTVLLLCLSAWLLALDQYLINEQVPLGIVSFELAGNMTQASQILQSWSPQAREQAMFLQGLDNLYLLVYPSWLALAITLLAGGLSERSNRLGFTLAWLVLLAIPLDLAENYALLQQLQHGASSGWAGLALACAVPKFTLVVLGFGGMLVLGLARILQRLGSS